MAGHATVYTRDYIEQIKNTSGAAFDIHDIQLWDNTVELWVAGSTHAKNDVVVYDGDAFKCISATGSSQTTVPHDDTTHWQKYADYGEIFKEILDSLENTSTTDEKVKVAQLTQGTTYMPILASATGTATRQVDDTYKSFTFTLSSGTTRVATLKVGGNVGSSYSQGLLHLHGTTSVSGAEIKSIGGVLDTFQIAAFGTQAGQTGYIVAKVGEAAVGSATIPVYIDASGHPQVTTSIPSSFISGSTASAVTGISISNHGTTSIKQFSTGGSGSFSATVSSHILSFSHTHTAATGADVTVVTGATHSITDGGHTHALHS